MQFIRFIFPFLFVRNWHNGSWEFSRARFLLVSVFIGLLLIGFGIIYVLQMPVEYIAP